MRRATFRILGYVCLRPTAEDLAPSRGPRSHEAIIFSTTEERRTLPCTLGGCAARWRRSFHQSKSNETAKCQVQTMKIAAPTRNQLPRSNDRSSTIFPLSLSATKYCRSLQQLTVRPQQRPPRLVGKPRRNNISHATVQREVMVAPPAARIENDHAEHCHDRPRKCHLGPQAAATGASGRGLKGNSTNSLVGNAVGVVVVGRYDHCKTARRYR